MTAARVFAETFGCPLRTRDTVLCDTPLSRAMSLLVNMAFSLVMVTTQILASKPAQHSVPRCLMAYVFKNRREKGLAGLLSGAIFVTDLRSVGVRLLVPLLVFGGPVGPPASGEEFGTVVLASVLVLRRAGVIFSALSTALPKAMP